MADDKEEKPRSRGTPRGPLGDAIPDEGGNASLTRGGQKPEKVEDRPVVGTVKPEDYPRQQ